MLISVSSFWEYEKFSFQHTPQLPPTTHMCTLFYLQRNPRPLGSECWVLWSSEATDGFCGSEE